MVDGDATYSPSDALEMTRLVLEEGVDMCCAVRISDHTHQRGGEEYRLGHRIGNKMFSQAFSGLFGMTMSDVFSGYRAMSRGFVKSYLGAPRGFEIEIELNAHLQLIQASYHEVPSKYVARPPDSASKLRTYRDGFVISRSLLRLYREFRPFKALALVAIPFFVLAVGLGLFAIVPYLETGRVERFPSLIASLALAQACVVLLTVGYVLKRVTINRREVRRSVFLREARNPRTDTSAS